VTVILLAVTKKITQIYCTYMAQQPIFGEGLSEKIPPFTSISSAVSPVTGPKGPAITVPTIIRPPGFRSSLISSAFWHGPKQGCMWYLKSGFFVVFPDLRHLLVSLGIPRQSYFHATFNEKHKTLFKSLPIQLGTQVSYRGLVVDARQ
jgi:hypothetical protein